MPRWLAAFLEDREFLKLWGGSVVSTVGFHVSVLAMQLTAALVLGASAVEMGLLAAAQLAPRFLLGLVAGVWVDRLRRRPLLIASDLGRAALVASIPAAHLVDRLSVEQLYVVTFGVGALSTVFETAILSYLPGLVLRERLIQANSRMHAGEAAAQVVGPNLAGALVQWLTAPFALVFDAVSYVVSALCLVWIRRPEAPPVRERSGPSFWREAREGLTAVARHPVLRALALTGLTQSVFAGGIRGALIVLYLVELGISPLEFGLIYGVGGAAALGGAVLAVPLARVAGLGRTLIGAQLLAGLFAGVVPVAGFVPEHELALLLAGQIGLSFVAPIWGVNGISLQQAATPDRLLGRVNATSRFASAGAQPLAAIAGGGLAVVIGLQGALAIAAAGSAFGALWLVSGHVRRLRGLPSAPLLPA